ncbi:MAG: hypothetical protein J0J06_12565 [Sphingomonas sp.]|uniref:hypothetical protein n=1 Tax=Sphingomonas sp. TaxID=28214 RepID=UPI001AD339D6|nr:hypothetical protein [Sphingomonas sp.]MBN8816267.1 hypothetical protein [Sphingomonas sp.]
MTMIRKLLLPLVAALALAGCDSRYVTVRYRVTITVDDAGTTRTGSGVWSYSLKKIGIPLVSPYHGKFEGQPILVGLSDGRTLFLLTEGRYNTDLAASFPENLFGPHLASRSKRGNRLEAMRAVAINVGARATLDCDYSKPPVYSDFPVERAKDHCLMLAMAKGWPSERTSLTDLHNEPDLRIRKVEIEIVK